MLLPQKCTKYGIYVVIEITSHNNIYFDSRKRSYNSYVAYRSFTALAFYPIKGEKKERKKRKKRKKKTKQRKNSNRRLEETKILDLSLGSRSKVARWRTHLLASCRCSVSSFCHRKAVRHRQFLIVSVIFHKTSRKRADVRRPFSPLLPASVGNRIARFSLRLLSLFLSLSPSIYPDGFRGLLKMIAIPDKYERARWMKTSRVIRRISAWFFPRCANFSDQSADRAYRGKRRIPATRSSPMGRQSGNSKGSERNVKACSLAKFLAIRLVVSTLQV